MNILVIGASGLVGSHVYQEARVRGHRVLGTYRSHPVEGLEQLDLGDAEATRSLLDRFQPDWVVHAAGWTWVDGCENDRGRAFRENCEQPEALARLCAARGCRLAYFSTTYVFDGLAGPYDEHARPAPINVYAESKALAEQRIQDLLGGQALIPRVICVWGREAQQKNFVYQALKALREGRDLVLPSDQLGNPTWAGDIAWWLLELIETGATGIWNLAGDQIACSRVAWFAQIRAAAHALGWVPSSTKAGYRALATAELTQPARRPLHAGAVIAKLRAFRERTPRAPGDLGDLGF